MRQRRALSDEDDGFTLIELLVVVVIMGILAGIAIPTYMRQRDRGYEASVTSDLRSTAMLMEAAMARNGSYPEDISGLEDLTRTAPVSITVGYGGPNNFCLEGRHDAMPGVVWAYQPMLGGLQGRNTTC
jgi:type IV pilus assembly protein PilA